jgi:hypothetical protein
VNRRKLFLQGGTQMLACQIAVDRLGRRSFPSECGRAAPIRDRFCSGSLCSTRAVLVFFLAARASAPSCPAVGHGHVCSPSKDETAVGKSLEILFFFLDS